LIQELVALHGGTIRAESKLGEGTVFTVALPLGDSHLASDRVVRGEVRNTRQSVRSNIVRDASREPSARAARAKSEYPTHNRPRVLVADDNADMREYVTNILAANFNVVTAHDGEEALERIRERAPDLVVTDIMMPRLDGLGLLRAIREDPVTRTLPVIFLSARAGEEMRVEGLQAGADDYLVNPFTANELRARVATHTQMAITRREGTEREAALRAEAERARDRSVSVLESITDGFISFDRDWHVT